MPFAKRIASLRKPVVSAVAFFSTLCVLSVGYAAYSALSKVNTGDPLSKDAWNAMVDDIADHEARISSQWCSKSLTTPWSYGNRSGLVTGSATLWFTAGTAQNLVDGMDNNDAYFTNTAAIAGKYLRYQFPTPIAVTSAILVGHNTASPLTTWAVVKWQGSNDGTTWTDVSSNITTTGVAYTGPVKYYATNFNFNPSKTPYSYYQMLGVSGTSSGSPWLYEILFEVCN